MITCDVHLGIVRRGDRRIDLSMQEYKLFLWFWLRPGRCFCTRELLSQVYGCKNHSFELKAAHMVYQTVKRINTKVGARVIKNKGRKYFMYEDGLA